MNEIESILSITKSNLNSPPLKMSALPETHRAVVADGKGGTTVDEKALPKLHDDSILVKVKAVTLNP